MGRAKKRLGERKSEASQLIVKAEGWTLGRGMRDFRLSHLPTGSLWFLGMGVVLEVRNISTVEVGMSAMFGEQGGHVGREKGLEARGLGSGACLMGIRVQVLAWLCQGAAESATGQWASWGWPTCQPSAVSRPHRLPRPPPLSRWPHSCPVCHNPKPSAPPGLSVVVREKRGNGKAAWREEQGLSLAQDIFSL